VIASGERSIAAGGDLGIAITGDGNVVLTPEALDFAATVVPPPGSGNLPAPSSDLFLGREDELLRLRREVQSAGPMGPPAVAVHGLGGVGKSSLALHYAHTHRTSYCLVWWIDASSPERIDAALADLAGFLVPYWAETASAAQRTAWATSWLQRHPGWLLVHDNVENPADLRRHLGALPDGHHLATSRRATGWRHLARTVPLEVLSAQAAVDLLCRRAWDGPAPTPSEREQAVALAGTLGFLPLALEQAGAYLAQTRSDIATYRQHLGDLLDEPTEDIDPQRTVGRIWAVTLDTLTERDPLAVSILAALSWLDPDGCPRDLFHHLAPRVTEVDRALGRLHAYSMVTLSAQEVGVHRLVQAVLRTPPPGHPADRPLPGRADAEQAVAHAVFPEGRHQETVDEDRLAALVPQVLALTATARLGPVADDFRDLALATSAYLMDQGQRARALPLLEALADQSEREDGPEGPDTLTLRNLLALSFMDAGDLRRALPLLEETLALRLRVLGPDHEDTMASHMNLALARAETGDLERAVPAYEEALAAMERALGKDDALTLMCRNNLADAYSAAGEPSRAVALHEANLALCKTALEQYRRLLGAEHPETIRCRAQLADVARKTGDLGRSVQLWEEAVAQLERVRGKHHPETLTCLDNLALAVDDAGDVERAVALHRDALASAERTLGAEHRGTVTIRGNLASALVAAGDVEAAAPLLEVCVDQRRKILGDEHPDTVLGRHLLAYAYAEMGDLDRAVPLYQVAAVQHVEVLGAEHPETLKCRSHLAGVYSAAGRHQEALELYEATLSGYQSAFGADHEATMTCRNNFAVACGAAGRHDLSVALHEANLVHLERVLGRGHPDTENSRRNLAVARKGAAKPALRGWRLPFRR
jgi:tetratricopeptide (TPR) repeat protein